MGLYPPSNICHKADHAKNVQNLVSVCAFYTSLSVKTKWYQKPTVCTDGWGICWIQLLLDDLVKVSVHVRVWKLVILIVIVFLSLFQLLAYVVEYALRICCRKGRQV